MRHIETRDVFGESGPNGPLLEKYGLTTPRMAGAARALVNGATMAT